MGSGQWAARPRSTWLKVFLCVALLLLVVHCAMPKAHCALFLSCCSLPTAHCSLLPAAATCRTSQDEAVSLINFLGTGCQRVNPSRNRGPGFLNEDTEFFTGKKAGKFLLIRLLFLPRLRQARSRPERPLLRR